MKVKPALLAALLGCALVLGTTAPSLLAKDTAAAAKEPAGKADKKTDKKADKPVNAKCPVSEEDVDPAVTLAHKGKTIAFCCKNCAGDFKKEPAKYLKALEEQEKVSATKEGGGETEEAEEKEPAGETEETEEGEKKEEAELNAKCPVSGDDADPATAYKYKGREVAFCCEECMKDFKKAPEKFVKNLEKKDKKDAGDKKPGGHEEHEHEEEEEKEGA